MLFTIILVALLFAGLIGFGFVLFKEFHKTDLTIRRNPPPNLDYGGIPPNIGAWIKDQQIKTNTTNIATTAYIPVRSYQQGADFQYLSIDEVREVAAKNGLDPNKFHPEYPAGTIIPVTQDFYDRQQLVDVDKLRSINPESYDVD